MRNFDYNSVAKSLLTPEIVSMLTAIHEFKGQHDLFINSKKDALTELLDIAIIQSTEASNKIEGIKTSDERIKKLALNKTMPKTRSEQEIAGYRDVLNTIHESYEHIAVKPTFILQLHRDLYKFSSKSIGGSYKNSDNVITEIDANGNEVIRFIPVHSWEVPEYMESLCAAYEKAVSNGEVDNLLLIPMFILDFLCIHPFNDGNGRMSRLLTLLLLYKSGYMVGKYISIEKVIETTKETYYETLKESSINWHENKNNYEPFVRYILGVILSCYRDFSSRILLVDKLSKPQRVEKVIYDTIGKITKAEILRQCPDISSVTVQRTLAELVNNKKIEKVGAGRYTAYVWNGDKK